MYLDFRVKINMLDNYILLIIKKYIKNKYLDILMPIITIMGNLGLIWIIIAFGLFFNKPYKVIGEIILITLVISTIIGEGIVKHLVRRIRPCNDISDINLLITKPMSYSFPSGHTLSSFAIAEVLSVSFNKYSLIFIGMASLIALSRLYLYVHYPTDIIGGIALGLLCSKLVFTLLQKGYFESFIAVYKNIH